MKIDTLCRLNKKQIEKHKDAILEFVLEPEFICMKCTRVCKKKKYLCKPEKLV
jgi:hypothetical protein